MCATTASWMRDEAEKRIGHLYPKVLVTEEMAQDRPDLKDYVGRELTVIAWLWARTVKSPNPAFADVDVPLASTFVLSKKKGHGAYVEPVVEDRAYRFEVRVGTPPEECAAGDISRQAEGLPLPHVRRPAALRSHPRRGPGGPPGRPPDGDRRRGRPRSGLPTASRFPRSYCGKR